MPTGSPSLPTATQMVYSQAVTTSLGTSYFATTGSRNPSTTRAHHELYASKLMTLRNLRVYVKSPSADDYVDIIVQVDGADTDLSVRVADSLPLDSWVTNLDDAAVVPVGSKVCFKIAGLDIGSIDFETVTLLAEVAS